MEIGAIGSKVQTQFAQAASQATEKSFADLLRKIESGADKDSEEQDKALKNACLEFESIFIYQMLSAMRSTVPENELIPEGQGEKVFKTMLDQEYSSQMSKAGGIGLADILYKQLSRETLNTKNSVDNEA